MVMGSAFSVRELIKQEGVRALFCKGLVPSLLGVSHGAAQLIAYERIKEVVTDGRDDKKLVSKKRMLLTMI